MTWDEFLKWANESPLGSATVGGLIVAAIVGLVALIPRLRKPVWSAVRRAWALLTSIRVTTTKQIEAGKDEARDEGGNEFFTGILGEDDHRSIREILMGTSPEPQKFDFIEQVRGDLVAAAAPSPSANPAPKAHWSLSMSQTNGLRLFHPNGKGMRLTNHAAGVEALDVHVEADNTRVGFPSGAWWSSVPGGEAKTFTADFIGAGGDDPIIYTIHWREGEHDFSREMAATSALIL